MTYLRKNTIDRLTKLADYLENHVNGGRFHLYTWREKVTDGNPGCGTTACAVGHACDMPEFQALGLSLEDINGYLVPYYEDGTKVWQVKRPVSGAIRITGPLHQWDAVYAFFELSAEQAVYLFSDDSYHYGGTLQHVVNRIRHFVKSDGQVMIDSPYVTSRHAYRETKMENIVEVPKNV